VRSAGLWTPILAAASSNKELSGRGRGRSGGYRLLVAYRSGDRAVFLYGFAKSERDNITNDELATLRDIGQAWLDAGVERLEHAMEEGVLQELRYGDEEQET
jgi:hypothetical protein